MNDLVNLKGLQFIHINARSILHKISGFRHDFLKDCMRIIGVSETWLNSLIPDSLIALRNYSLICNDRNRGREVGTCLYIRNDLDYKINPEVCSNDIIEIQSVTLTGERERQKLRPIEVVLIYRPPRGNDKEAIEFIHNFIGKIGDLDKKGLIILGDLNWNMLNQTGVGI